MMEPFIQLFTAGVLFVTAIILFKTYKIANKQWSTTKRNNEIELLYKLLNEFSTVSEFSTKSMLKGIGGLKNYFKECGEDKDKLKENYRKLRRNSSSELQKVNGYRIPVSHFFQKLATIHEEKMISDKLIFETWSTSNLSIIPNIIIPMEECIETCSEITIKKLRRLHKDSLEYTLRKYLDKEKDYTETYTIKMIKQSGIDSEILKEMFEQLKNYGDSHRYSKIYEQCEKVNFESNKLQV